MNIKPKQPQMMDLAVGPQVLRIVGVKAEESKDGHWRFAKLRVRSMLNGATGFLRLTLQNWDDEEKNANSMDRLSGFTWALKLDDGLDIGKRVHLDETSKLLQNQLLGLFFKAQLGLGKEFNGKKPIEVKNYLTPVYSAEEREKMQESCDKAPSEDLKGWGTPFEVKKEQDDFGGGGYVDPGVRKNVAWSGTAKDMTQDDDDPLPF